MIHTVFRIIMQLSGVEKMLMTTPAGGSGKINTVTTDNTV